MKTGLTNRLKKVVAVVSILLFFSPTLHPAANDGVPGITPEGVHPITQSGISMKPEEIIITMTGTTGDNGVIPASQTNEAAENETKVTRGRLIHTEEETVPMLVAGTVIVLISFLAMVIVLLLKKRNPGYLLFIGQIACLAIGLYKVVRLLTMMEDGTTMASENISLGIGLTAVAWAVSMLFMAGGIILVGKKSGKQITDHNTNQTQPGAGSG